MTEHQNKKRRRKRSSETRPDEIINAALDLFVEHGYTATKLDDIAAHVGITKGTIYLYFENKEKLFQAVIHTVNVKEIEKAKKLANDHKGSQRDLLHKLIHYWWDMDGKTRLAGITKLMISEANNFPELSSFFVDNVTCRARTIFVEIIEEGIINGEFRKLDANYVARLALAPLVFAVIWEKSLSPFDKNPYDVKKYLDLHVDLLLNGLNVGDKKSI